MRLKLIHLAINHLQGCARKKKKCSGPFFHYSLFAILEGHKIISSGYLVATIIK